MHGRYIFPRWSNRVAPFALVGVLGAATTAAAALGYYGTTKHLEVGYEPVQPVPFSHKLHAGDMGMDCRYCHSTVEKSAFAAIPPTQTCMNCHDKVLTESVKLLPVRESAATGDPIPWVRVHNLPDYAYFDHSAHLAAGVGCSTCHGRVDQMITVRQDQPLSMGWCLDCHRNPGPALRDPADITKMDWQPDPAALSTVSFTAKHGRELDPPQHCSGCHR